MSIREYLLKACQDDAVRAGERDRQLLEAQRAGMARRQRPDPAAPAAAIAPGRRLARLMRPGRLWARLRPPVRAVMRG